LSGAKAIAGIGINVSHNSFPPELAGVATSLAEWRKPAGAPIPREPIVAALLHAADEYLAYDTPAILRLFTQASSYAAGRRVEVQQADGVIRGVTAGLNPDGFLVVRQDDGTDTLIIAGGVRAAGS
jgi:BirA family biotin operon repressor/biotin-[acetyl-CoA-carboxylase] ligase